MIDIYPYYSVVEWIIMKISSSCPQEMVTQQQIERFPRLRGLFLGSLIVLCAVRVLGSFFPPHLISVCEKRILDVMGACHKGKIQVVVVALRCALSPKKSLFVNDFSSRVTSITVLPIEPN